jgi:hypothetical protein
MTGGIKYLTDLRETYRFIISSLSLSPLNPFRLSARHVRVHGTLVPRRKGEGGVSWEGDVVRVFLGIKRVKCFQ